MSTFNAFIVDLFRWKNEEDNGNEGNDVDVDGFVTVLSTRVLKEWVLVFDAADVCE